MQSVDLKEYFASDSKGITDLTTDGKCSRCGECCKDILPIDYVELARIKKYVKEHHILQQEHHLKRNTIDMTCPFLNIDGDEKKCVIYPVRPQICKKFICSMSHDKINALTESRGNAGKVMSLRKEVFDDDFNLHLTALAMKRAGLFPKR